VAAQKDAEGLEFLRLEPRPAGEQRADAEPVAKRQMPVAKERSEPVADRRLAALLVDHRELERQPFDLAGTAHPLEEAQILVETAESDVLAVVGRRLRVALALGERLHLAAECWTSLEQPHIVAGIRQVERGREAGETATNHNNLHRASAAPTTRSLATGESDGGPSKTSKPSASIRSSVEL